MKYNIRVKNYLKFKLFRMLVGKNHSILSEKTGYFSVFLDDSVSNSVQVTGLYESEILIPLFNILLKQFNFTSTTAVDIGANIGNHTVFFSDFFKKVHSFEPNPMSYKLLSINTFFLKNVEVHNLGLADTSLKVNLSVLRKNIGGSSAVTDYSSGINHQVNLIKLDEFLSNDSDHIALIKIDVEGMENPVLQGAANTIKKHLPIILFEQLKSSFENGLSITVQLLDNEGYYLYLLKESHYSNNKWLKRLKRVPLMITSKSLRYSLIRTDGIKPDDYPMIIAIHSSKIRLNKVFY